MAQKTEKEPRYYNDDGVDVTERIGKKTTFFFDRIIAETFAFANRSYKYEIFDNPHSPRTVVGYGVPK